MDGFAAFHENNDICVEENDDTVKVIMEEVGNQEGNTEIQCESCGEWNVIGGLDPRSKARRQHEDEGTIYSDDCRRVKGQGVNLGHPKN